MISDICHLTAALNTFCLPLHYQTFSYGMVQLSESLHLEVAPFNFLLLSAMERTTEFPLKTEQGMSEREFSLYFISKLF